jgi:uncharacterized protein (TIGR02452 family)
MLKVFEATVKETAGIQVPGTRKIHGVSTSKSQPVAKVMLVQDDTLGAAQKLREKFPAKRILILNFANNNSFCGGGTTQEEDIARRTNLYHSINQAVPDGATPLYPISSGLDGSGIEFLISREISVVKDRDGIALVDAFRVNVLSAAAIINPRQIHLSDDTENIVYDYANRRDADIMRAKIKNIMNYARASCDILVLGAWGMGAFHNPEYGLIQLWNSELCSTVANPTSVKGGIIVVFAVPGDKNNNYTLQCFKKFLKRF